MAAEDANVDYWSLTSPQLAARISQTAQSDAMEFNSAARTEAGLLAVEWQEALKLPTDSFEDQEARRARIAALQRRSIEILIHTSHAH